MFAEPEQPAESRGPDQAGVYRVLARKYRPARFADLIGQDALVRTLTNAIRQNRIAHAFMLTGVRGVGKTTSARIVARALNCTGHGGDGPTPEPCGVCDSCRAIAEDRHVDVLEMDAASRTGVDDIRELIDGVRYAPTMGRYKVYIVDEVHMLSRNAFNALLKTLEEPPPHVKFIFATTEIRKVPVTVLSRCQRFDLRRVDAPTLRAHFDAIAAREGAAIEDEALALIARAADGSVRDGLSLLDQAIAMAEGTVTGAQVRSMLGLADRAVVLDLMEAVQGGRAPAALAVLDGLHAAGADAETVAQDLLELTHLLTRLRVDDQTGPGETLDEQQRRRAATLAAQLKMPELTRTWQILLKGLGEIQVAPMPFHALEMVILRLIHAADLPSPGELLRRLGAAGSGAGPGAGSGAGLGALAAPGGATLAAGPLGGAGGGGGARALARAPAAAPTPLARRADPGPAPLAAADARPAPQPEPAAAPLDWRGIVALAEAQREMLLHAQLRRMVHPVSVEPGQVVLRLAPGARADLPDQLRRFLARATGRLWSVLPSEAGGGPTLVEEDAAERARQREAAAAHPLVRAVLAQFPNATISAVRGFEAEAELPPDDGSAPGAPDDEDDLPGLDDLDLLDP